MTEPPLSAAPDFERVGPLPPRPAPLIAPRRVSILRGVLGLWFRPRRTGPHLAAGPWWPAILVYVFSVLVGGAGILAFVGFHVFGDSLGEIVDESMQFARKLFTPDAALVGRMLALVAIIVGALLNQFGLSAALMPWAAAGESMSALLRRCVKGVLWGSSLLLPLVPLLYAGMRCGVRIVEMLHPYGLRYGRVTNEFGEIAGALVALAFWGIWSVTVMLRALCDYAGPPAGPGWEPLSPRCESCGYSLLELRPAAVCPECGDAVANSLPLANPDVPRAIGPPRRTGCTLRHITLLRQMLVGRPLRISRPREEMTRARRFFVSAYITHAAMIVATMALVGYGLSATPDREEALFQFLLPSGFLCGNVGNVAIGVAMWTFLWGWWRDRRRDPRVAAVVALRCTAFVYPVVWLGILITVSAALINLWLGYVYLLLPFFGQAYLGPAMIVIFAASSAILGLWTLLRVRTHLADVQYCNS